MENDVRELTDTPIVERDCARSLEVVSPCVVPPLVVDDATAVLPAAVL